MITPVASRIRVVCAARNVRATTGSSSRMSAPIGRPATGDGQDDVVGHQERFEAAASAARAKRAAASG